jgi:putative ubiquitin-RnfH superfamily antitoxin RatB of RatAB toxin-antitoxin module
MAPADTLAVTVVVAGEGRITLTRVEVAPGSTVAEAVELSGALAGHAGLDPGRLGFAIHGRAVRPEQGVEAGDRIEVLRPLLHDPRDRRRALAREGRSLGRSARGR